MSSDRLALDPTAAAGDPFQRLAARVAELEQQMQRVATTRVAMTVPKVGRSKSSGIPHSYTYSALGGFVVVLAFPIIQQVVAGGATAALTVDGVQRDTFAVNDAAKGTSTGTLSYASSSVWTGDHTITVSQLNSQGGGLLSNTIIVMELPNIG